MGESVVKSHFLMDILVESARNVLDSQKEVLSEQNVEHLERIISISKNLYDYCEAQSTKPSPQLDSIRKRTHETDWSAFCDDNQLPFRVSAGQMIGITEGTFIAFLAKLINAKHCLEIGMLTGYGTLTMAEAVPDDGTVTCLELQAPMADHARENLDKSPHGKKVSIKIGPAAESLQELVREDKKFDLIFIDADKPSYKIYLDIIMDNLLAPGGLIIIDNTLFGCGMFFDHGVEDKRKSTQVTLDFNKWVSQDPRMHKVMLPIRDGMTLITRAIAN